MQGAATSCAPTACNTHQPPCTACAPVILSHRDLLSPPVPLAAPLPTQDTLSSKLVVSLLLSAFAKQSEALIEATDIASANATFYTTYVFDDR